MSQSPLTEVGQGDSNPVQGDLRMLIGGRWAGASTGRCMPVVDPATGGEIATVPLGDATDADLAMQAANRAFHGEWSAVPPARRGRLLIAMADLLTTHLEEIVRLDSLETGKPLSEARSGARICARYFEYYAGMADKLQGETIPVSPDGLDFTVREPLGVTVHVIPWNVPLSIFGRSVAPALAAGNTAVVKVAEQAPAAVLRFAELVHQAGLLPDGTLNVVTGLGSEVGEALVTHAAAALVVFTGSVATGRRVMQAAARNITPVVLELGGKAPFIVLDDADVSLAVPAAVRAVFRNSGQLCTARTRLLVHRRIYRETVAAIVEQTRRLRIGPGLEDVDMGPVISAEQRDRVLDYIRRSQEDGAVLEYGGHIPDDPGLADGFFIEPTVFSGVRPQMAIACEEVFGPVLAAMPFDDDEHAAELANATPYGLSAEVWSSDFGRALRLARKLDTGRVGINGDKATPEVPMAGFKASGIGVEKGLEGLRNYTRVKSVHVALGHD